MKFPFTFDLASIFRLFIPGFCLAIALDPIIAVAFNAIKVQKSTEFYYGFGSVLLGWLISVLDMHIYMLYEGRRFWPPFFVRLGRKRERKRLDHLKKLCDDAKTTTNPAILPVEYEIQEAQFPMNEAGQRDVTYPTRLGNLITEYEQYPDVKYGMDGVFYWYRVWFAVPKDVRDELTQQQSIADSSVYISFVLFASSLLFILYALLNILGLVQISPNLGIYWLFAAMLTLACSYGFYEIALQSHSTYGSFFKAMFDEFHTKIDVKPLLSNLARRTGIDEYNLLDGPEAYKMAWRYLRWHNLRRPGEKKNVNAEKLLQDSEI